MHYGDHQEFAKLVKRWEEPIRRLCTRMTGDPGRGDDLKQETFLRLFEKRKTYQPTARFSTYLWRLAINICLDELRRQQRRPLFLREDSDDADESAAHTPACTRSPDQIAAETDEGELVRKALLQLPDIYRTVLVLRHYEGMKLSRIAEVLQIPEGTVNSRMAEALARISRILEPQFREPPKPVRAPNGIVKEKALL